MSSRDASRQWVTTTHAAREDHWKRYELAAHYAGGKVLDAACGCGYGSKILLEHAELVVGVDSSAEAIEWAIKNFQGPHFICGSIEEKPWTGKFETVVSLETIEHIKEPKQALLALREACTGTLIASVPNEERYQFTADRFSNDDSPHFRHYTPREFDELLEECGFRVTERFCQKDKQGDIHAGTDGVFLICICE
jgi:2-polyprenyl-3-methyl-5-hydroxy-6-metoxy-1,4-benzoquinol methylase